MSTSNNQFYASLPVRKMSLGDLLVTDSMFADVPADWHVIITDIKSSTLAVMNGRHENVNLIATGSIVTVLNIAFAHDIILPFFFGGDGATFIVPPAIVGKVMAALALYKTTTQTNFNLELRTGIVPVEKIYADGYTLKVAKYSSSEVFIIPVVIGDGLSYAEQLIKGADYLPAEHDPQEDELDLTGMQCRWDKIAPPEDKEEVVTLLIVATHVSLQQQAFREVMNLIDGIYGSAVRRQPISVDKLKLKTTFSRIGTEVNARLSRFRAFEMVRVWVLLLLGRIYFRTSKGQRYLKSLVQMSDTLVLDGRINTVISGTTQQRKELQAALDRLETEGRIFYGIHLSNASIMSCYVRDMKDGHIHFIDGSEGGYTKAAAMLKTKIKSKERVNPGNNL
jgi:hypothetical protein